MSLTSPSVTEIAVRWSIARNKVDSSLTLVAVKLVLAWVLDLFVAAAVVTTAMIAGFPFLIHLKS